MSWFKVDDGFYDHPKVFDAPDYSVALWTRAGSWSARNLTDGFVPNSLPARLCGDHEAAIRELVDRGLWKRIRGGYQFHDWTDYQPTRADVEAERERWRRNKARQRGSSTSSTKMSTGDTTVDSSETPQKSPQENPRGVSRSRPVPESLNRDSRGGRASALSRGARAPSPAPVATRPPARCVDHEFDDDPPRCAACLRAERISEQDAYEARIEARHVEMRAAREDHRREVEACAMCDERGYVGNVVCNHDPGSPERAVRGRALIDEAMGWSRNGRDAS